ncbi:hypothetical protein C0Q70_06005 [Pomacea canaliculata]|uniref:GTP-binding protein 8 n=1 Tax=Pomacea canaliculata TaxID=400727 RepID=A0A2T7PMR5_POMCA|nr:GTP-binding protein 8-like [Pomacea canaliculata]PVD34728.1 hypothetical protein C0Q70_06005 [Pomacea canaliculata]
MPSYVNPLIELQKYVSIPIIPPEEAVFSPTEEEVFHATKIFTSSRVGSEEAVRFVGTYINGAEMPESSLPEVAFLGRSNVGKSSLIRSILGAHPQVRVNISKKPGHTKALNLYCIRHHFTLVDMPGYGFNMPHNFEKSVEAYLCSSRRLCRTFLLVDADVGLTCTDNIALGMMKEAGIPFVIVLTKIDKASRHKVLKNLFAVVEACKQEGGHTCFSQPFLVSSHSGEGLLLLETFIAYVTGCIEIKGQ